MAKTIQTILIFLLATTAYIALPDTCPEDGKRCAFVFVVAAGMWALEIFPIYVTSLIVVLLLCFLLTSTPYTEFLVPFGSPVIMLFFGGFILAQAMSKHGLDAFVASKVLNYFRSTPLKMIFGIMFMSAFLSMWISNTAATVMMIGIARPIFNNKSYDPLFRKGLILSIPLSANIGGLATPIGSPPNALAIGFLNDFGISITFFDWMAVCCPLVIIFLAVIFSAIALFYLKGLGDLSLPEIKSNPLLKGGYQTLLVILATVVLWLTSALNGIPESLTALLCVGALMVLNLISREDVKNIEWDILILMWGGLALGIGIDKSGLGIWIADYLFSDIEGIYLLALLGTLATALSLFISNTASAALIIPIALRSAGEMKPLFAITIAIMCSIGMVFPISTPPNAIAFGTGEVSNREMIRVGSVVTICCYVITLAGFWWIIPYLVG